MVRKKGRYLVYEIQYADNQIDNLLQGGDIFAAVRGSIHELYGDYGSSIYAMDLSVKYFNPYTGVFFVRCPRDYHKEVRASITFIKMLKKKQCVLTCIQLTATIKSAERFLLDYNTDKINLLYKNCKTPKERNDVINIMKGLELENLIDKDKVINEE